MPIQKIIVALAVACCLTYLSLMISGQASVVCGDLGAPVVCPVLAYGFPMPFLADSQAVSPVGSVARDPLSLLTGEDEVLWLPLAISASFWLLVVLIGRRAWRRISASPPPSTSA